MATNYVVSVFAAITLTESRQTTSGICSSFFYRFSPLVPHCGWTTNESRFDSSLRQDISSLLQSIQASCAVHLTSFLMGTGDYLTGVKCPGSELTIHLHIVMGVRWPSYLTHRHHYLKRVSTATTLDNTMTCI